MFIVDRLSKITLARFSAVTHVHYVYGHSKWLTLLHMSSDAPYA